MEFFFGYIDPGTGSLFIQAIIGTAVATVFVLRNFFITTLYKVKGIFKRETVEEEAND